MKTYSFATPPHHPGIYVLKNVVTGHLYIGRSMDLARRYAEWKAVFTSQIGVKSMKMLQQVQSSRPEDWAFVIVQEFPEATEEALAQYEEHAITRVGNSAPDRLLNSIAPRKVGTASSPKSSVSVDGAPIAYPEAAKMLGCSVKSLQKRLAAYRKRGVNEVTLEELKALTDKYRAT